MLLAILLDAMNLVPGMAAIAAAIAVIGAALGIGKIGQAALESTGRQPAVSGDARTTMIIAAALVEGVAFFALVICFLMAK